MRTSRCRSRSSAPRSTSSRPSMSPWWRCASTVSSATSASAACTRNGVRIHPCATSSPTRPNGPSTTAAGTVVGFRFPDASSGIEVPGYHLHFLSDDRAHAGHVLGLTLVAGDLHVDGEHELHVEVPAGMALGEAGALASEIHAVEGGPST